MKVRISMKIKLLLIFAVLTVCTVGTYLYFALNLFSKDKTASIHEASLSRVSFLSQNFSDFTATNLEKTYLYQGLVNSASSDMQQILN